MINKILITICLLLLFIGKSFSSDNRYYINLYKSSSSTNIKNKKDFLGSSGTSTNINIIAIRVEFQEDSIATAHGNGLFDLSQSSAAEIDPPPHNRTFFEDHLEALKRYYKKVSKGKINISYSVFPEDVNNSYKLPKEMKYYSPNTTNEELSRRLCELLRDSFSEADKDVAIDFSKYNSFILFHAGVGADFSVNPYYNPYPNDIPSVFLNFDDIKFNLGNGDPLYRGIGVNEGGFFIREGLILPETESQEEVEIGLNGIMAHQFGHQLGLPSLFNTETGSAGIGQWGLMDMGFGNYSGLIPAEPCAWSKVFLGWEKPIEVDYGEKLEVHSSLSDNPRKIYKVNITSEEYYLIENRNNDYNKDGINIIKSPSGVVLEVDDYDADIPGTGLLILHIDERIIRKNLKANKINADQYNKGVYLEEADGSQDIGEVFEWILPGFPTPSNGIAEDAFFSGNNDAFSPITIPSSKSNYDANSHIYIYAISDAGNIMTFDLKKDYYYEGFPTFTGGKFYGLSPNFADIDGDDKPEIIAVTRGGDLLAWNGEDGTPVIANNDSGIYINIRGEMLKKKIALFAKTESAVSLSPLAEDFNNDEKMEVAVITEEGKLFVWTAKDEDDDGRADLLFQIDTNTNPTSEMIALKLNNNKFGIIFGDIGGRIYFIDNIGEIKRKVQISNSEIKGICLMGNNLDEENIIAVSSDGRVTALTKNGEILWEMSENIKNPYIPAAADLDRDGNQEVVVVDSSGKIIVFENNGSYKEGFPKVEFYPFLSPPSIGDVDGDGYMEILIRSTNYLFAYNYNGTNLNNFPIVVEWGENQPESKCQIIIGDINGDNLPDIITGTSNGLVKAFDLNGNNLDGFPLTIGENVKSTPIIADLDGNGDIEIAALSDDLYLYVWDFDSEYNPERIPCGSYLMGSNHSNRLIDIKTQPLPPSNELLVKELVYNYPNPTEGNFTTVHYFVNYPADIHIKIYDLSGEVIDEIRTVGQPLIDNEVIWNLDGIESGVYNARLEAVGNGKREYKFFKIAVIK